MRKETVLPKKQIDDKPICYHCQIPIREIHFAYWVKGKPHCSLGCASKTKDKSEKVNRWEQKA